MLKAQYFGEMNHGFFKPSASGFTSWCDINNDGRLDLFVTGYNLVDDGWGNYIDFKHSIIYINDGSGAFHESNVTNIPRLIYGSCSWGDFNNDGWADLVITGTTSGFPSDGITQLFINNQDGSFVKSPIQLPGMTWSEVLWFDYNHDGWQDLFLVGLDVSGNFTMKVLVNESGTGLRDSEQAIDFPSGSQTNFGLADAVAGDFDNDMDQDIIVAYTSSMAGNIDLLENVGGRLQKRTTLARMGYGTVAIADFDSDGNPDVVINGVPEGTNVSETYSRRADFAVMRGDGKLNFSLLKTFERMGSYWGSVSAGDVNNDGLADIVMSGSGNGSARNSIFLNDGGKDFVLSQSLPGTLSGASVLGDCDNDGDLDLFVFGESENTASSAKARFYRNDIPVTNDRPQEPRNVRLAYVGNEMRIVWDDASDDDTNPKSISYNIRIGTEANPNGMVSAMSNFDGWRQLSNHGNTSLANSYSVANFSGTFRYQVQAIDAAYNASDFSPVQTACMIAAPEVSYKEHYCYKEEISVVLEDGATMDVYEDSGLTKLLLSGSNYVEEATSARTLYVTRKSTEGCLAAATKVSLDVSMEPELSLLVNGKQTVFTDTLLLRHCDETLSFSLDVDTNFPHREIALGNISGSSIRINEPGVLTMKVSDDAGCLLQSSAYVEIEDFDDLYIPNVITPNDDERNDYFVLNSKLQTEVTIVNRYGSEVFHTTDYKDNFNGSGLPSGVYYYRINIPSCRSVKKGSLHVIK